MFVWNHFTNDARVLRECTALSEAGYHVDLIAIHDHKDAALPKKETFSAGFNVIRVSNRIMLFNIFNRIFRIFKRHWILQLLLLFLSLLGLWYFFDYTLFILLGLILCLCIIQIRKMRVLLLRSSIFLRMLWCGIRKKYDVYHANDLNTLPQGILCSKVFRFRRSKLVYDSHEVQTSRTGYDSSIYGWMEKRYLRFVDVFIHENHTRADYIEKLYGIYPKVVHNYPFVSRPETLRIVNLREMLKIPADEPILLYQGGIQTGRGLDKIVQAVPMFKKGIVVFIGDGRIKLELEEKVKEMNLENRIKFLPKVPVSELQYYTPNAYLGFQLLNNVCFNHYSASSNKLFEYIMSGVPVIACSFPEIKKVVESEEVGICVDSHNTESIAETVNYFLDHPNERERMSRNCLRARDHYNWDLEKQTFVEIYQELLE